MTNELEAIREALRIAMRETLVFRNALNAVERLEAERQSDTEILDWLLDDMQTTKKSVRAAIEKAKESANG